MNAKERLLEFIASKGISKREFYTNTGMANGTLDKVENIGTDRVEKIYYAYPELNLVWLCTGQGQMLQKIAPKIAPIAAPNSKKVVENDKSEDEVKETRPAGEDFYLVPGKTAVDSPESVHNRLLTLEYDMLIVKERLLKGL